MDWGGRNIDASREEGNDGSVNMVFISAVQPFVKSSTRSVDFVLGCNPAMPTRSRDIFAGMRRVLMVDKGKLTSLHHSCCSLVTRRVGAVLK